MPPPPAGRSGVGGGHSECDCSAAGLDRSPRLGPTGLGLGSRSSPVAAHPTQGMVVVLPPLLRVWGMTTALVRSIPSTWIGMIPFGLFFASSGSSTVWRNWQV